MPRVDLRVPTHILKRWRKAAKEDRRSLPDWVRCVIEEKDGAYYSPGWHYHTIPMDPGPGNGRFDMTLEPKLARIVKREAKRHGVTKSSYLRRVLTAES